MSSQLCAGLVWHQRKPGIGPIKWCSPDSEKDETLLRSIQNTLKTQSQCSHEQTVGSAVAGMERLVCESCGYVSIKLVSEGITQRGIPGTSSRSRLRMNSTQFNRTMADGPTCSQCSDSGIFITPQGLSCSTHTIAYLKEEHDWIPVRNRYQPHQTVELLSTS